MSPKTWVIAGGTDGIGRALARIALERGDQVIVIGRNPAKAEPGAQFIGADLSLLRATKRAIGEVKALCAKVDVLVLAARHYRSARLVTEEGHEHNFALFYLARYLLGHGLTGLLDAAPRPVILNLAGPGEGNTDVRWDDLGFTEGYSGQAALAHSGVLVNLLGVSHAQAGHKARYVLFHPGTVATGFSGQYDEVTGELVDRLRHTATPIVDVIGPMLRLVDDPPAQPLTAWRREEPVSLDSGEFDPHAAQRLQQITEKILSPRTTVSRDKLDALLDSPVFAKVATVGPDGMPHQTVVWVARDGGQVVFIVAIGGVKERHLRRDSRVSVLVSPADAPHTYATIQGTAQLETTGATRLRDALAVKYVGKTYAELRNEVPEAGSDRREVITVRVTPDKIIGRL